MLTSKGEFPHIYVESYKIIIYVKPYWEYLPNFDKQ